MNIEEIKNKILQLAIEGKLVKQNPNDTPASVLLKEIKAEKERLIKEKKIKKEKSLPEITEEEKSFVLPEGWEWCRLGDIGDWGAGSTPLRNNPKYYNGDVCWIKTGELNDGYILDSEEHITDLALKECSLRLNKVGDVLIAMYGSTIGKLGILGVEATTNQACCACSTFSKVYNKYLFTVLLAMRNEFKNQSFGGAQPNISKQKIINTLMPLPPLEEQKRIVHKVEELFAIVHELNENKEEMLKNIANTRNKVLQLAVQGKLVEQRKEDKHARELLEEIKAEKEKLIKEKVIKKEKALPEITEEEKSFVLPEGWAWCRLGELSAPEMYSFVDGPFGSNLKREHYVEEGIRIIQLQNIGIGYWKDSNKIYTSPEKVDELIRCNAYPGELAIAKMNPIARATIIPENDNKYVLCSDCVKIKPAKDVNVKYLEYLMNSEYVRNRASEDGTGTTRQRTSLGKLKLIPIPLPPIKQMNLIVDKIDMLMKYLSDLENCLLVKDII